MTLARLFGTLALGSTLAACAPPAQRGMVYVAPGASERFQLAMRMGYLGTFDREMVPGQVRRAMFEDQLPQGDARTGRVGDYVLENGHVLAAITAIDGSARGGKLVDLARKPKSLDGLDGLDLDVLGQRVVYDSLKTGNDDTTQTAYIEVSGRIDRAAADGSLLTVSTRYDAAPGIDGIVVHTHIKLDRGTLSPGEGGPGLLDEQLRAKNPESPIVDATNGFGASMGSSGAYLFRPLFDGATLTAEQQAPRFVVGVDHAPTLGDSIVVTRIVTPLERPDTGALAVAVAKTEGRGIGDIEVRVAPKGKGARFPNRGDLAFVSSSGARYEVCDVDTSGEDSHFGATLPAGQYTVFFNNRELASAGAPIDIEADRVAFLTVAASARSDAGDVAPSACPLRR
ncbi:MAG: hypothetical protein HOW73_09880 [Polyangiaceae bacterium]|nr:hypothetical protein [Polyangiaceae bacterium]